MIKACVSLEDTWCFGSKMGNSKCHSKNDTFFFNVKIACFLFVQRKQVNHLYVDFPKRYGFLNYNHHSRRQMSWSTRRHLVYWHKSRTNLFLNLIACIIWRVQIKLVSDQASLGLLGMSLCVQMAQRAAGSLRARNPHTQTQHCSSLAKLLSYIPSVKQTHFIENPWSL